VGRERREGEGVFGSSLWNRIIDRKDPERRRVTRFFLHVGSRKLRWFISAAVRAELGAAPEPQDRRLLARQLERERPRTLTQSRRTLRILEDLLDRGVGTETRTIDLLHLSISIGANLDYLVSWDVRDLANERVNRLVREYCRGKRYNPVRIGTPEQVLEWLIEGRP
jgi:hypothetical protein